jgi:Domain of unknown function (DUF4340)
MMTSRRLLIFAVLALLAITGAVLLANQRATTSPAPSDLVYPQLKAQADSVKAIRIYRAGDARALELIRNGADWTVSERDGYPAAGVKARRLVQALADAKVLEEKTADPTKYATLAVEDVTAADAKGVRIELEGPVAPVDLIVGKDGAGGKSSYVRRAGEPQSWLVNTQLSASPEIRDWLDKDIINVSADRIQSATIALDNQKAYSATKATRADADFKVEPLPKGKELSSPSAANGTASALMSLTLDDVQPKASAATGKPAARATYRTFDGLVLHVEGYKKDDKRFITLSPTFDATLAEQFRAKTAADDKPKPDSPLPPSAATGVEDETKKAAAKVANWAYEIPEYKFDAIFRPLDEMLKK